MKRILLLLTVFFMLFVGKGYSQFIEDFEGGIPADWATFKTLNGTVTVTPPAPDWGTTTTGTLVCEGTQSAYIDRTNIGAGSVAEGWLVTPQITVPPNGRLYFTAKQTFAQDYGTEYIIRYSTNSQTNIADFTDLQVFNETTLSPIGWNECFEHGVTPIIDLSFLEGQDVYFAFVKKDTQPGGAPNADRLVLDLVKVLEACLPPTNLGAISTADSAELTWTGSTSGTWEVEILEGTNTPGSGAPTHTGPGSDMPFSITGLNDSTSYTYYVRANCGDSVSEWAGPFNFSTTQVPVALNYFEDFESASHGWQTSNGTQTNKWFVGTATSNGGTHSLYISNDNGTTNTYTTSAASTVHAYRDIQMPATVGQIYLSYDWKTQGESCCDFIRAWIVPASFAPTPGTQIAAAPGRIQLGGNHNMQSNWVNANYVINAEDYAGQIIRIVFEWRNDTSVGTPPPGAIDNVNIEVITCSAPSGLAIDSLTESDVTFTWNAPGGTPPDSYDYYFSTTPTAPISTTTPTDNVSTNSVSIGGLEPSTTYYFWVRSNCGVDGASFWVGPISFNTAQIPTALDYFEDFEGPNPGWTLNNGTQTNKWFVGEATSNSPTHSLYISNDNGVTNNYTNTATSTVHAYKDLIIPATANQILLSYDWKAQAESCCDFIRVWIVPITFTPTPGTQITAAASGGQQFGANHNMQANWVTTNHIIDVAGTWAGQLVRLVFEWRNDGSVGTPPPGAVDNVNVSVITCPSPNNLALDNLNIDTAEISWNGVADSYDYYLSTSITSPLPTTEPTDNVSSEEVTLTGLTDSTTYYFWVRSNCGVDGVSFWVGPLTFNTPQIPVTLPFFENFDGPSSGFSLNNGTQTNKWVVGEATFNSPPQSMYVSNNNGVTNAYSDTATTVHAYRDIQLPASVGEIFISYDWKCAGEGSFDFMRVWLVPITFTPTPGTLITAANAITQFTATSNVGTPGNHNLQPNWTTNTITYNANAYEGQIVRLVFEWRNDGSVNNAPPAAVDNINVSVITCSAPTDLAIAEMDENSVTFTWNAPGGTAPESYDYYISTVNSSPAPDTDPTGNTTETTVTIEDLEPSTQYFFWVRSNCGDEDGVSFWVGPVNFNTPQIPADMNFYDDFEGDINWTFNNGTQINQWVVGTATSNSPTHSLYISNDNGISNTYAHTLSVVHAYRDIQMPASVNEVILSYDWKAQAESCCDYMRVWIVPITYTPVPGIQITAANGQQFGGNHNQISNWTTETYIINAADAGYAGQIVRLVFEWRNDGSVGTMPPAAVDNVILHALTCPSPVDLLAETTQGSLQVNLSWNPVGTETQWEIIIQESGAAAPSPDAEGIIVNEPNYTFLAENDTLYEFYVRAVCDEEDISFWSGPGQFSIFVPPGCAQVDVVGVGVEITDSTVVLCPEMGTDVSLAASFYGIAATTSYEVEPIDYAPPFPFTGGIEMPITADDDYTASFDLPFNFCFFGESYSFCRVGDNGVITFGMPYTTTYGEFCPWQFNGLAIPNTNFPIKNSIYGVYQDLLTTNSPGPNTSINYQVLGTYPCRALVVNFNEVPTFGSCTAPEFRMTTQIVLYEISNIIEVYVENRDACMAWPSGANAGQGVLGIQNAAGTVAYTPPGRNTGSWNAQNEAWRFVPNGDSDVDFQWLQGDTFFSDNQEITVSLTPEQEQELLANGTLTIQMTAEATYATCTPGEEVTTSQTIDIIYISSLPTTDPQNLTSCAAVGDVIFDLTENTDYVLGNLDPAAFLFTYYTSEALAEAGDLTTAIQNPADPTYPTLIENYVGDCNEVIWMRIADVTNSCYIVKSFQLICGEVSEPNVDFAYPQNIFCSLDSVATVSQSPVTTGGVYTATPAGLSINPATGAINIAASTAGTYDVTYTVEPNACTAGASHTVTIEIIDPTAVIVEFSYDEACDNAENSPLPTLVGGFATGGVFSSDSLSVNPQSGAIDMTTATVGTHEITYTIDADSENCTEAGSHTATIVIVEGTPSVTDFSYDAVYCYSDETAVPTMVADYTEGGTFSATPAGLSINAQTGVISISDSTPGTYLVTYSVAADPSICMNAGSSSFTVTIFGEVQVAVSDECRGNAYWIIASPVDDSYNESEVIDYTWIVNEVSFVTDVPEFNVTENMGDNVLPLTVTVIVNNGCDNYAQFTVTSTACMIQKGISPNGDGLNEYFDLTGMGVKKLSIYSRYGREVYTKSNYVNEWKGQDKNDNELPTGTYFYSIERSNGENVTGWIYVNRSY